ncbi:MAG: helix-turn-helix transcriptional regulator [Bacilli bacterium]|nr:helix-turn-helix transcriptional regulator [Bacilli bacterium]
MNLGEKLINLRKKKGLSQEEVADKLNVTRQTISKWETNQSTPDFDKIIPLCELFEITTDELFKGQINNDNEKYESVNITNNEEKTKKRTIGLISGILLYFIAVAFIVVSVAGFMINPIIATSIFIIICGIATCIIIYSCVVYKKNKVEKEENKNTTFKQIENIVSILTVIIYLGISFITMAWHLTWIIWLIYALVIEIIKLILSLRGEM